MAGKKKRKEKRLSLLYILGGGILKEDFIVRHTKMIFLIVLLTLSFIGNKYSCDQKIKQINVLEKQLVEMEMEALSVSVELARYSQRSQIEKRVRQYGLSLESPNKPPYLLHR